MKYLKLTGICAKALKNNWCAGCNKLELPLFTGEKECEYVEHPVQRIKQILGIQEKMKL